MILVPETVRLLVCLLTVRGRKFNPLIWISSRRRLEHPVTALGLHQRLSCLLLPRRCVSGRQKVRHYGGRFQPGSDGASCADQKDARLPGARSTSALRSQADRNLFFLSSSSSWPAARIAGPDAVTIQAPDASAKRMFVRHDMTHEPVQSFGDNSRRAAQSVQFRVVPDHRNSAE